MKLIDSFGHFRGNKIQIVANYAYVPLEFHNIKLSALKEKEFLHKNPTGKIPVLETLEGYIYETNAIIRYIYRQNPECGLYGQTIYDQSLIDQWLDFISFEVEPSLLALLGPILGWGPQLPEKEKALADLRKTLEIIENHLKFRTFLVGNSVSLADISLAGTLVLGFKFLLEPKYRQGLDNIIRWFELISHQEAFFKVIGNVKFCEQEFPVTPIEVDLTKDKNEKKEKKEGKQTENSKKEGIDKKNDKKQAAQGEKKEEEEKKQQAEKKPQNEKKPQAEKKQEKPKEEQKKKESPKKAPKKEENDDDEEEKPIVKPKNPLDLLPASKFDFNEFKNQFANSKDKSASIAYLWQNFDSAGYSIWFSKYQKVGSEGKELIKTFNLLGGHIRALDNENCRKYAFGVYGVFGETDNLDIKGCWVWRGVNEPKEYLEYYDHIRCDPNNENDRKRAELYWKSSEEQVIEGGIAHKIECYK